MLVDLIDKLIDRIIQLVNYRKQVRKTLLDDYISPIYSEFERVHKEYLVSFEKYRDLIKSSDSSLGKNSPILDLIRKDNLFTADERAKIIELARIAADDAVDEFVHSIYRYLVDARVVNPLAQEGNEDLAKTQLWRRSLLTELTSIFEENWQVVIDPFCSSPLWTSTKLK